MEITDGHELIGVCPYDLNSGCVDRSMYKNINIPVITEPVRVDTNLGIFILMLHHNIILKETDLALGFPIKLLFSL